MLITEYEPPCPICGGRGCPFCEGVTARNTAKRIAVKRAEAFLKLHNTQLHEVAPNMLATIMAAIEYGMGLSLKQEAQNRAVTEEPTGLRLDFAEFAEVEATPAVPALSESRWEYTEFHENEKEAGCP